MSTDGKITLPNGSLLESSEVIAWSLIADE